MKHYSITLVGLMFLATSAFAQTKTVTTYGKHEKPADYVAIQPRTVSLGVGAAYNPTFSSPFMSTISTKYFFNEKWALRAYLQFGRKYEKQKYGGDSGSGEGEKEPVVSAVTRNSNFMLYAGFERRYKLSNRFFGYCGSDLAVGASGSVERTKEDGKLLFAEKYDRSCNVALLPLIGIEMFLGPKISISTEFGYSLAFKFYSKDVEKTDKSTEKTFPDTSISSNLDFGNSIGAGIRLAYYF